MICNKHIEIHMELVNKIQSLREEYKQVLKILLNEKIGIERTIQKGNNTKDDLNKKLGEIERLTFVIRDLEELLK